MYINVPDSWIREYIETEAKPEDIAKALSLRAFSVEKIIKWEDGDAIYEIEVTPNRGDALSVQGIARELLAILPRFSFGAKWLKEERSSQVDYSGQNPLEVIIKDKSLVPRFSAVVLDKVQIKDSNETVKERLEKVGIRPLNNVIDVTNYLMIELGQPMHVFDYDKIMGHKMILRESLEGESLVTLDGVERKLPSGVIVIEDGDGRLIDLCGIMGCENSAVGPNTKKVLLFVQIYDPVRIRKASMSLGHRTDAALRFEKGVDIEGVVPGLKQAVEILKKDGAEVASSLTDIINVSIEREKVQINYDVINLIAGVQIKKSEIDAILKDLGFEIEENYAVVPSWRWGDIEIPEDIAEEVIRLYGYDKIPDMFPTGEIPTTKEDKSFYWEEKVKDMLKFLGFFESYTYSMTTEELAGEGALALSNPLSEEFAFLRTSLIPQLLEVLNKNKGYSDKIKLFELSSVYLPKEKDLPEQPLRLSLVAKGVDYLELKGVVEDVFYEMGIKNCPDIDIWEPSPKKLAVELDFEEMVKRATKSKTYTPISKYNSIKEDFTFVVPEGVTYPEIENIIRHTDPRVLKMSFKDLYENKLTLSVEFLDTSKQITSEDTKGIRQKILDNLKTINVELSK